MVGKVISYTQSNSTCVYCVVLGWAVISLPTLTLYFEKLGTYVHLLSQKIGSWVRLITLRVAAYFLCHRTRRCKRSFCLSCSGDTGLRQTSARLNEIISSISATKYKQCSSMDLDFLQIMYRSGSLWNTWDKYYAIKPRPGLSITEVINSCIILGPWNIMGLGQQQ